MCTIIKKNIVTCLVSNHKVPPSLRYDNSKSLAENEWNVCGSEGSVHGKLSWSRHCFQRKPILTKKRKIDWKKSCPSPRSQSTEALWHLIVYIPFLTYKTGTILCRVKFVIASSLHIITWRKISAALNGQGIVGLCYWVNLCNTVTKSSSFNPN